MKLLSLFALFATATAFGPKNPAVTKSVSRGPLADDVVKPAFRKSEASKSPLFRDPTLVRGGAVPGWAAYNRALDESPLTAKALTSLVGWALGDLLAQVRINNIHH